MPPPAPSPRRPGSRRARLLGVAAALTAAAAAVAVGAADPAPRPAAVRAAETVDEPLRVALYSVSYPEDFGTRAARRGPRPTLGRYRSADPAVIARHIAAMRHGDIDAGVVPWDRWGVARLPRLLALSSGTAVSWAVRVRSEARGDPGIARIRRELRLIGGGVGGHPAYLRRAGRFVVFVPTGRSDGCAAARRWARANTVGAYLVMEAVRGRARCASAVPGWYALPVRGARARVRGESVTVRPGTAAAPGRRGLARSASRWRRDVAATTVAGEPIQLVDSFNDWVRGTAVESARPWRSPSGHGRYLDALSARPVEPAGPRGGAPVTPAGGPAPQGPPSPVTPPSPPPPPPPPPPLAPRVVAAVGDIACSPADGAFNGGLGTATHCRHAAVADLVTAAPAADAVLPLGDIQYESGELSAFRDSYALSWGRFLPITRPIVGNHEYGTGGAAGYFDYFGAAAGPRGQGWYSYDLGAWHVVALNSNCAAVGGCHAGSPQEQWLRADLAAAATRTPCVLALWHHPRFSSGRHGDAPETAPLFQALQDARVELLLSGHDHHYERFAPMTADGGTDEANGVRQFIVGTGGRSLYEIVATHAGSETRRPGVFGLLKLSLEQRGYRWSFVPVDGAPDADTGAGRCR